MSLPSAAAVDVQPPRIEVMPDGGLSSAGQEAIELAEMAGLHLDPWQQYVLDLSLRERSDGNWLSMEMGLVVARQNGKGAILEARELAALFLFGDRKIVHSAHRFDTSKSHMERMSSLIQGVPEFDRRIKHIYTTTGQESILLKDGRSLQFRTRSGSGGRGLTGDLVVFDEAMELPDAVISSLMPLLTTRPNPQMWYVGSAVDQMEHAYGHAFAKVRHRALTGDEPALTFVEYSVDPDVYNQAPTVVSSDREQWRIANPGIDCGRVNLEWLEAEFRQMSTRQFATEVLSVGDWPDVHEDADRVIGKAIWDGLFDAKATIEGSFALAIDTTPERDRTAIAACGAREDLGRHVEVTGDGTQIDHQTGTRWVVPRVLDIVERHGPCAVIIDGQSPAATLIPELEEAGLQRPKRGQPPDEDHLLVVADTAFMVSACGSFYDAAVEPGDEPPLSHPGQEVLNRAQGAAKKRPLGDRWAWARKSGGDISPLVAATLAHEGHRLYGDVTDAEPFFL